MSIDKSLRRKNSLSRNRSVLKRWERIEAMQKDDKWTEGRSPFGLPKTRVQKIVLKKAKKEKTEEAPAAGKKK
jgi:small basic protein (TIGR04137 family)